MNAQSIGTVVVMAALFSPPAMAGSHDSGALGRLTARVAVLEAAVDDLTRALDEERAARIAGDVPDLANYVSVIDLARDLDGDGIAEFVPTVLFKGINVQIVDGSDSTVVLVPRVCDPEGCPDNAPEEQQITNGLGNLIIGYDESRTTSLGQPQCTEGTFINQADCEAAGEIWADVGSHVEKSGSHNVVIGRYHFYTKGPGLVAGEENIIRGFRGSTVSGGRVNIASGQLSSVSGGGGNRTLARESSISGGGGGIALGDQSSVSGGQGNHTHGHGSSISGGFLNTAHGVAASVSGGDGNQANGQNSSVSGGSGNRAVAFDSSISGGRNNDATGEYSSVSGGHQNSADGMHSSVSGGFSRSVSGVDDWRAGGAFQDF